MQPFNGRRAYGVLKGLKAFWLIFIETELFEHECLILMICLAVLLIKLYVQNLAGTANTSPAGKIQWNIYGPLQVRLDSQLL